MTKDDDARFAPSRSGGFDLRLPDEERELLAMLPGRMLSALSEVGATEVPESLRRLFPAAYTRDADSEASYVRLVREDLVSHHRQALQLLSSTAQLSHLDDETARGWLTALTDLRLLLGTTIGITEEQVELLPGDQFYFEWACYHYLSALQHELVTALSENLEPPSDEDPGLPDDPWGDPPGDLRWDGTPNPDGT